MLLFLDLVRITFLYASIFLAHRALESRLNPEALHALQHPDDPDDLSDPSKSSSLSSIRLGPGAAFEAGIELRDSQQSPSHRASHRASHRESQRTDASVDKPSESDSSSVRFGEKGGAGKRPGGVSFRCTSIEGENPMNSQHVPTNGGLEDLAVVDTDHHMALQEALQSGSTADGWGSWYACDPDVLACLDCSDRAALERFFSSENLRDAAAKSQPLVFGLLAFCAAISSIYAYNRAFFGQQGVSAYFFFEIALTIPLTAVMLVNTHHRSAACS